MMRDTRVSFAPVVDITDPDFQIKQNQPLATDDFGSGAVR
jgi:tRNA-dihydrouridine synthase